MRIPTVYIRSDVVLAEVVSSTTSTLTFHTHYIMLFLGVSLKIKIGVCYLELSSLKLIFYYQIKTPVIKWIVAFNVLLILQANYHVYTNYKLKILF